MNKQARFTRSLQKMKYAKGKHGSSHCKLQIIVLKFRSKECLDSRQRSQVFEMGG